MLCFRIVVCSGLCLVVVDKVARGVGTAVLCRCCGFAIYKFFATWFFLDLGSLAPVHLHPAGQSDSPYEKDESGGCSC